MGDSLTPCPNFRGPSVMVGPATVRLFIAESGTRRVNWPVCSRRSDRLGVDRDGRPPLRETSGWTCPVLLIQRHASQIFRNRPLRCMFVTSPQGLAPYRLCFQSRRSWLILQPRFGEQQNNMRAAEIKISMNQGFAIVTDILSLTIALILSSIFMGKNIYISSISIACLLCTMYCTYYISRGVKEKYHWYESLLDVVPLPITDSNMKWTFVNKVVEDLRGKRDLRLLDNIAAIGARKFASNCSRGWPMEVERRAAYR